MYLTKEEEKMYRGEYGLTHEWAMKFLVSYGEAFNAERLTRISSAGVSWSVWTMGKIPEEVYEGLTRMKMAVPTYTVAGGMPDAHWKEMGISKEDWEKQVESTKTAKSMEFILTETCAPYLAGWIPIKGSHIATVESSCIAYFNSVFGARTHRDSFPSCFASAITGRTPYFGFHTERGRMGNLLVKVEAEPLEQVDYEALGYYVGEIAGLDVPVFTGIPREVEAEHLKGLGAALATSGGVGLYHIVGVTPEAPTLKAAFGGEKPKDTISVGKEEIKHGRDLLCTGGPEKVDFVMLGCPHYTVKQLARVAELLQGKKVHRDVTLWVFAPSAVRHTGDVMGITDVIKKAGGLVLSGTCPCGARKIPPNTKVMATDAAKQAHYATAYFPVDMWFGSVEECVNAAITGQWGDRQ